MEQREATHSNPEPAASQTDVPKRIGSYTILSRLYDGSISTLYKAKQDRLGRVVALKTLKEWPPAHNMILERFNRATFVGAQVVHPNVPVLYESGTVDGYHFAALEYIHAQTLQELLAERTRVSERRAVWIGLQVARALSALHAKRIIHRNVKPKNILVEPDGRVRLVGMGLAKVDAACFTQELDAQTIGTPHYMAPEIIRGCCTDPRSDLYSLGVTMYVMVTGRPPFAKGIPAAVMAKHLYEKPDALKQLDPDLSDEFVALVEHMMAKCPHERPESAEKVAEQLERMARRLYRDKLGGAPALAEPWHANIPWAALARGAGVFFGTLLAVFLLGMATYGTWAFFWNAEPAPAAPARSAPIAVPAERPTAAAEAQVEELQEPGNPIQERIRVEFLRLVKLEEGFRRDGWQGVGEWERFLRTFPDAPEELRARAQAEVRRFRQQEIERMGARAGRQDNPGGEDLEF